MTSQASGPPPIVYIVGVLLLAGGGWYFFRNQSQVQNLSFDNITSQLPGSGSQSTPLPPAQPVPPQPETQTAPIQTAPIQTAPVQTAPIQNTSSQSGSQSGANILGSLNTSLPNPAVIQVDGSVTMVGLSVGLKAVYTQQNPGIAMTYGVPDGQPRGSNAGMQALLNGEVQLAATSRPLNAAEIQAGIRGIPVARDALAVVVGVNNPYQGGLTMEQLKSIFQGRITNWSQVGGPDRSIRVLNRSPNSGTYTLFQDLTLLGQPFAPDGPNFITFEQDVTTPILRALETDGISYTTVAQADNQLTVRIVPINGTLPTDETAVRENRYPLSRFVFYAAPNPTSPAVRDFLEFALSAQGQEVVSRTDFLPL